METSHSLSTPVSFFPSTFRSTGNNSEQLSNEDLLETTQQEMMFLKKELARKEEEITKLRQVDATFTETATFNLEDIENWTIEQVISWFESLGLGQYKEAVLEYRVNGLLLVNLEGNDWAELGIQNALHIKKIEVS
mmetsp:Transcript_16478/g.24173  ORF Transcript_16478/g.24173 Transcript_16478/m.24173 type:complete len:136 (+) Transcript_16478:718-1125(+)